MELCFRAGQNEVVQQGSAWLARLRNKTKRGSQRRRAGTWSAEMRLRGARPCTHTRSVDMSSTASSVAAQSPHTCSVCTPCRRLRNSCARPHPCCQALADQGRVGRPTLLR